MNTTGDEYDQAWEELRRRRMFARPLSAGLVIMVLGLCLQMFLPESHWAFIVLSVFFVIALPFAFVGGLLCNAWRCPRCGRRFNAGAGMRTGNLWSLRAP